MANALGEGTSLLPHPCYWEAPERAISVHSRSERYLLRRAWRIKKLARHARVTRGPVGTFLGWPAFGAVYGAITGPVLVWLLRQ